MCETERGRGWGGEGGAVCWIATVNSEPKIHKVFNSLIHITFVSVEATGEREEGEKMAVIVGSSVL